MAHFNIPRARANPAKKSSLVDSYKDIERNERKAMAIFNTVGNLRLNGDTGVGKSTFVHYICAKSGWADPFEYSLNTDTTRWDLIAQDVLRGAQSEIREGIILQWLLHKLDDDDRAVLFLDEFNYAQPNVTTLMNQLTDFRRNIYVPELMGSTLLDELRKNPSSYPQWTDSDGNKMGVLDPSRPEVPLLHRSPNHYVIIAMNPAEKAGYAGAGMMNIAQLRRFESLELHYLPRNIEEQVIKDAVPGMTSEQVKKMSVMADGTRKLYKLGILSTPLTTGNLLNYGKMLIREKLSEHDIGYIMASMFPDTERQVVEAMWLGKTSAEVVAQKYTERGGLEEPEEEED